MRKHDRPWQIAMMILSTTCVLLPCRQGSTDQQTTTLAESTSKVPNILLILADDLGVGDLACYGNPVVETPVIDALATAGIRLTAHYAPSPLCAPSRAGYLTGRFNHRTGAVDVPSNRGLDRIALSEQTFGDCFRAAGYRTALIGKWHNGLYCRDYLPHQRGFDHFFGFANGGQDYWKWKLLRNDVHVPHDGRYLSDVLNHEAAKWIRESARADQPFAIFLAHHTPHSPLQAPASLVQKYRRRMGEDASEAVVVTYAMIEAMDTGLGQVFQTIKEEGLWERTVIVFTSDNGAFLGRDAELGPQMRFHAGLAGNKGDATEQGMRVPAIVAWPGNLPAGQVVSTPVHGCDWLPTLYRLTGRPIPARAKPWDGMDVWTALTGDPTPALTNRVLFFQRNRYAPVRHSNAAIRSGDWKLFWPGDAASLRKDGARDNPPYRRGILQPHWEMPLDRELAQPSSAQQPPPRLYHLGRDPAEEQNVADAHPRLVELLARKHDAWFDEVIKEWWQSRAEIIAHDQAYWKQRTVPESGNNKGN